MSDEPISRGATLLVAPVSTRSTDVAAAAESTVRGSGTVPEDPVLIMLAQAVADHGVAAHEPAVRRLAEQARELGLRSGALEALEDRSAADVVRARALVVVLSQLRRLGEA